ncbi:hypothetical protein GCM10009720_17930 [Yaniella flava]|uniref:Transposase n=1 Tax=Yaniella flava TaxID=287930 RepID=A0ABN2UK17_9MICC
MNEQKKQRRSFTDEYKREAAGLVIDTGRSIAAVAREIKVGEQTLGKWVKLEKTRRGPAASTGPLSEEDRAELQRLRQENFELKKDNEFLGKAALDSNRQGNTVGFGFEWGSVA